MVSMIHIEVVYVSQNSYQCIALKVQTPCTIEKAIEQSGILSIFSEINFNKNQVGIYNQLKSLAHLVEEGDRIEIYRPLHQSAMSARRQRAKQQKAAKKPLRVSDLESR